jgi:alpha-D-xyloside xylohydrolase
MDIDYMNKYLDFTLDPVDFPLNQMTSFVSSLHKNNQHFVPIVDPGIYVENDQYPAFVDGVDQNVFIMDQTGESIYLGQVWPGSTYFPDWFAANTQSWWTTQLKDFHDLVAYDGIWIDMNEVSNFCNDDGSAQVCYLDPESSCPNGCCLNCTTPDPTNIYDFPPFVPHVSKLTLGGKTVAASSLHAGGILEYNSHSLYGFMESIATKQALITVTNKRPFLLSRSTYSGSGVHTAHWTGDNAATWDDLAASIITMNNMALFGIPMVGADICGFIYDTTEELCARWIEVGAFSPFSRDHNIIDAAPQELYRWSTVAEASRTALGLRYRLLPHLYTLMFLSSMIGNPVHNAMWMHFPADSNALVADGQYMWGGTILFTPVLTQGANSVTGYFPQGVWYSLFDNTAIDHSFAGDFVTLNTPLTSTNVHVRGGHIIPMQDFGMTTSEVRSSPFTLVVALAQLGFYVAEGFLFIDDGEQLTIDKSIAVEYTAVGSSLVSNLLNSSYSLPSALLTTVEVLGVDREVYGNCTELNVILQVEGSSDVILPNSMLISHFDDYVKLTIIFDAATAVNVANSFTLRWECASSTDDSTDDDKTSTDSSDSTGWDSIALYGQVLIIISIILVVIGGGVATYFCYKKKQSSEPLLPNGSSGIF